MGGGQGRWGGRAARDAPRARASAHVVGVGHEHMRARRARGVQLEQAAVGRGVVHVVRVAAALGELAPELLDRQHRDVLEALLRERPLGVPARGEHPQVALVDEALALRLGVARVVRLVLDGHALAVGVLAAVGADELGEERGRARRRRGERVAEEGVVERGRARRPNMLLAAIAQRRERRGLDRHEHEARAHSGSAATRAAAQQRVRRVRAATCPTIAPRLHSLGAGRRRRHRLRRRRRRRRRLGGGLRGGGDGGSAGAGGAPRRPRQPVARDGEGPRRLGAGLELFVGRRPGGARAPPEGDALRDGRTPRRQRARRGTARGGSRPGRRR